MSASKRLVPIWMFVVCWLVGLPILGLPFLIDSEFPVWLRVVFFGPLLALTIGLLRRRVPAS